MENQKRIKVRLEGLSEVMFDRFIDHSKENRPPEQKLYLSGDNLIVLPAENLHSFLFGQFPVGCAKAFEGRQGSEYIRFGESHVFIAPLLIPFLDGKNKPIKFNGFGKDHLEIWLTSGRTKKGSMSIKQEAKPRPYLKLPWALEFNITLLENPKIDSTKLENWFRAGGITIAIGTAELR